MALSTGYDQSIRSLLNQKNVDNSQIGYNPTSKSVTVGGQDFMKADKLYNGSAFTNSQNFNNAWSNYSKSLASPTGAPGGTATVGNTPQPNASQSAPSTSAGYSTPGYTNQWDSKYLDMFNSLLQQAQNPTPYDPYSSAEYVAAKAQADRAALQNTTRAIGALGTSGIARSSMAVERANNIQNDSTDYLMTQVIPQLIAQNAAKKQADFNNMVSLLGAAGTQQGVVDTRFQNDQSNAIQKGQLTGTYLSPEMSAQYNRVLQDKQTWANAKTPEERAAAQQDAEAARAIIAAMGGNPDLVGSNVTYDQAAENQPRFGVQTQAAKQYELDRQRQLERDKVGDQQYAEQFAYQKARDAIADARWKSEFDENTRQFGLKYALDKLAQDNDQAYRQAQLALAQDDNARAWAAQNLDAAKFDYAKKKDASQGGNPNKPKVQTAEDYSQYIDSSPYFGKDLAGNTVVTDKNAVESMILQSGLPDAEMRKLYARYGIPME